VREESRVSGWIALLFAVTAGIWCFTIPIGEAPDEREHLQYAEFIRDHGRLPTADDLQREAIPEAFQAPLYHAILSGLSAATNFNPSRIIWFKNPIFDRTSFPGRANEFDHAAMRAVNASSDVLKFNIMRLPNVLFGALMIWILLQTMRTLGAFGSGGPLVIVAASTPLLTFTAGTIGNDMLAALFSALCVFALVRKEGRWIWIAAVSLALGLLVKMTVLFLWFTLVAVMFWSRPRWRLTRERLILMLVPLLSAAWTLNRTLYFHEREQGSSPSLTSYIITAMKTLYHCASTAVGVVGVHSIWLPGFVYGLFFGIDAVVLYRWFRNDRSGDLAKEISFAGWLATILLFLVAVYWYRESGFSMHSRLFLPFVPASLVGPAMAWSETSTFTTNYRKYSGSLIVGFVLLIASFLPTTLWLGTADTARTALSLVKPAEHYAAILSLLLSAVGAFLIMLIVARKCLPLLIAYAERKPTSMIWMAAAGFGANLLILFFHVRFFFL